MEKYLKFIGENIDKLVSIEMRGQRPDQGLINLLYQGALEKLGASLTMAAAESLVEAVSSGDTVIIATGAGRAPFLPKGETDGPLGAAVIARILRYGLGAIPVLVCEADFVDNIAATCIAAGLAVPSYENARVVPFSCTVQPFPHDETAREVAQQMMSELEPKALIAVEKLGPNVAGVAHSSIGKEAAEDRARVEHLFQLAQEKNILTIGIGDNGNEIGFGLIEDTVREHKQYGDVCQCPCGQGVACAITTDFLIVAGTSNWGSYGLEACLAAVLKKVDLIHDIETEKRMLEECVRAGGVDASTGKQDLTVDGTPATVQTAMVELMCSVVSKGLGPGRKKDW